MCDNEHLELSPCVCRRYVVDGLELVKIDAPGRVGVNVRKCGIDVRLRDRFVPAGERRNASVDERGEFPVSRAID